jgi:hypothetical protein
MASDRLIKITPTSLRSVSLAGMSEAKLQLLFGTGQATKTLSLDQWNMLGSSKRAILRGLGASSFTVPT